MANLGFFEINTNGGFVMKDMEKFTYTPEENVNLYLKTAVWIG